MPNRFKINLNELHCVAQSESGGCEPYLFTSFFALTDSGATVQTPAHPDVRGAFADDVEAGATLTVPQEIGSATIEGGTQVGVVAMIIDEDLSRDIAVEKAHSAFHEEVEAQLNQADGSIDEEALRHAVMKKVRAAVQGTWDYLDLHRDQDDHLGLGIHIIGSDDSGSFELPLGFAEDHFILRGTVASA